MTDIRFNNVHLKKINSLLRIDIFSKNDLYINSNTLWELMQPIGSSGSHNYHELQPENIVDAIRSLTNPYCIFNVKNERFAFITLNILDCKMSLMVVIEIGSGLTTNPNANINKIVTIYPKDDIDNYLSKLERKHILFIKK